jgi:hypothetical protein
MTDAQIEVALIKLSAKPENIISMDSRHIKGKLDEGVITHTVELRFEEKFLEATITVIVDEQHCGGWTYGLDDRILYKRRRELFNNVGTKQFKLSREVQEQNREWFWNRM